MWARRTLNSANMLNTLYRYKNKQNSISENKTCLQLHVCRNVHNNDVWLCKKCL